MDSPDNDVLIKAQNGDYEAFEQLVFQYERLLYSVAYRMMNNHEDTQDMVQEAFIRIYNNIKSCHHIDVFSSWACTITSRICIDELRKRKNRKTYSYDNPIYTEEGEMEREFPDEDLQPDEKMVEQENLSLIEEALQELSPIQREAIILRDVHGFTYEEIAEETGSKLGTVKSRINRGRVILQEILEKDIDIEER